MSEDNQTQIIIHKSNWAWQFITVIIFLVILVALIVKNPSERDFAKACVKEYTQRQLNADPALSELVANLIDQFIGSELALPIESNDYLICSTFSFDQSLDDLEVHIEAIGVWGKIIFTDVRIKKKVDRDNYLDSESELEEEIDSQTQLITIQEVKEYILSNYDGWTLENINDQIEFDLRNNQTEVIVNFIYANPNQIRLYKKDEDGMITDEIITDDNGLNE